MSRLQRRDFLIGAGALLAAPFAAEGQRPERIARIGFLSFDLAGNPRAPESFLQGLRDLGYVEGRNVVIESRNANGKTERLPAHRVRGSTRGASWPMVRTLLT
jgi:putative ABC transport system substrate-binding protein